MNYTMEKLSSSRPFFPTFFFFFVFSLPFHTVLHYIWISHTIKTIILWFNKNNRWSVCSSREKIKFKLIKRFWTAELSSHKRIFCMKRSVFNSVCELISCVFFSVGLNIDFLHFTHIYHPLLNNLIIRSTWMKFWCINVTNWFWKSSVYRRLKLFITK